MLSSTITNSDLNRPYFSHFPDAGFLTLLSGNHNQSFPTVREMVERYHNEGGNGFGGFLEFMVERTNSRQKKGLETLSQEEEEEWLRHRVGRITASIAHRVVSFDRKRYDNKMPSIVATILGDTTFKGNDATRYGKTHEAVARTLYVQNPGPLHRDPGSVQVDTCGIFLDAENPLISASPDGLVKCKCCGPGLVEIKCLYQHKDKDILDVPFIDPKVPFVTHKGGIILKQDSKWYYQIVTQLGVTQREYCDLVVFTEKGIVITRCVPDNRMYKYICDKGMMIYDSYVFQEM